MARSKSSSSKLLKQPKDDNEGHVETQNGPDMRNGLLMNKKKKEKSVKEPKQQNQTYQG